MYQRQTPYHKRLMHRLDKSKQRQINLQNNRYTQIDCFLTAYEKAYLEYYQVPANITYRHGWYYMNGKRYQHTQMEQKLALLFAKLQEIESPNTDQENLDG